MASHLGHSRSHGLGFLLVALLLLTACGGGDGGGRGAVEDGEHRELVVFAAASLRDVLGEVVPLFEKRGEKQGEERSEEHSEKRGGITVRLNFAGSNVLAQQIVAARGADVFLSADEAWVDHLDEAGRLVEGSRRVFLSNGLVVVAHRDSGLVLDRLADLATADFRWLAIGDPRAVPAGRYARRALESVVLDSGESLWSVLEPRVAPAADVRAALAMVDARTDVVGIVYHSDVYHSDVYHSDVYHSDVYHSDVVAARAVHEVLPIPAEHGPEIRYVAALVRGGDEALGRELLALLADPSLAEIFERYGFSPPPVAR